MPKSGVEYLAQHPGWKTKKHKAAKRRLHTVAFTYSDDGQFYNEGAMLSDAEAKKVLAYLEDRQRQEYCHDIQVSPDGKPTSFKELMAALDSNYALHTMDEQHPQTDSHLAACPSCMMAHDKALPDGQEEAQS